MCVYYCALTARGLLFVINCSGAEVWQHSQTVLSLSLQPRRARGPDRKSPKMQNRGPVMGPASSCTCVGINATKGSTATWIPVWNICIDYLSKHFHHQTEPEEWTSYFNRKSTHSENIAIIKLCCLGTGKCDTLHHTFPEPLPWQKKMQSGNDLPALPSFQGAAPSGPGRTAEDENFLWAKTKGGAIPSPVWPKGPRLGEPLCSSL